MNLSLESQYTPCPKCQYTRKKTDTEPDYQCPACGVIYEKYIQHQADIQHPENSQNNHLTHNYWHPRSLFDHYRALGFGYIVFYAVIIAIERNGAAFIENELPSPLNRIMFAPIMFGIVFYGLQTGSVRGRFSTTYRSESPTTFWINIIFFFLLGLFMFCWGIADAFR